MARHTSKPLYIERVAYISNVSITKVGGTSAAQRAQLNCATYQPYCATVQCVQLYHTTCQTLPSNVPNSTVQRAQPYCQFVPSPTVQHAQPNCTTCPSLLCNVPNSTIQRAQLYYATCPALLYNVPSPTVNSCP